MSIEKEILTDCHTIAVVGLSADPCRPSYSVAQYLKEHGYRIIPVNPMVKEVLGEKSFPDLISIGERVDLVDIFRKSEDVGPIVEQAIRIKAKAVWMQEGVVNEGAAAEARRAGLKVVMDKCTLKEHQRLR